jgi:DNA-directed RNA polymerase sigma subunit (sigma70/sigma32)
VRDVVHALPEPQRDVIRLRYGLGDDDHSVSTREAARRLELLPSEVTAIERRALNELALRREIAAAA